MYLFITEAKKQQKYIKKNTFIFLFSFSGIFHTLFLFGITHSNRHYNNKINEMFIKTFGDTMMLICIYEIQIQINFISFLPTLSE